MAMLVQSQLLLHRVPVEVPVVLCDWPRE